jgi:hypothetical protein
MSDKENPDITSRRQFTKIVTGAMIAVPTLVSLSCTSKQQQQQQPCPPVGQNPRPKDPTIDNCFSTGGGGTEEHIPPMGITDGSSLLVETTGELEKKGDYYEEKAPKDEDKLGDIESVIVITESAKDPYVSFKRYWILPPNSQLLLWYQNLKEMPGSDECDYEPTTFDPEKPAVRIQGGNRDAGRPLRMSFPKDLKPKEKTHKCKHPHRYRQADNPGPAGRHFRIGQWRIVDGSGKVIKDLFGKPFEDSVNNSETIPEHFLIYINYDHYNPPRQTDTR